MTSQPDHRFGWLVHSSDWLVFTSSNGQPMSICPASRWRIRFLREGFLLAACLMLSATEVVRPSQACPVCISVGDPFSVPHPHSIRLAVATRNAIDGGRLSVPRDRLQTVPTADLIRMATHQLTGSSRQEEGSVKGSRPIRIDVLIVDRPSYFRIELRGDLLQVFPLTKTQHPPGDSTIVTTRAVITALADLEMTIAEAVSLKLLEVEGDQTVLPHAEISTKD